LKIAFAFRSRPFGNSLNFDRVHIYLAISYYYSKVFNFRLIKFTFFWFEIKFVFSKVFHHLSNMMSIEILVEDEDIIKVYENMSLRDLDMKDVVHHHLEGSRGIGKSEKHGKGFEKAIMIHLKGSFEFVSFFNMNIVFPLNV